MDPLCKVLYKNRPRRKQSLPLPSPPLSSYMPGIPCAPNPPLPHARVLHSPPMSPPPDHCLPFPPPPHAMGPGCPLIPPPPHASYSSFHHRGRGSLCPPIPHSATCHRVFVLPILGSPILPHKPWAPYAALKSYHITHREMPPGVA